jgi:uncharacterized protein (DUF2147 family)
VQQVIGDHRGSYCKSMIADWRLAAGGMKTIVLFAILLATASESRAQPLASIVGRWLNDSGKMLIEIAPCGKEMCGHVLRMPNPTPGSPAVDAMNPDPTLRARPLVGLPILTGFIPEGDHWRGQIYNPKSGRTYRSQLVRAGNSLTVKACIGPFCRTLTWTLAK